MVTYAQPVNLMIVCPNTGKNADTGHTHTAESYKAAVLTGQAFECGQCHEFHAWTEADLVQKP